MTTFHPSPAKRPAFTLVEILVVIVIIGVLAGLAIPATMNAVGRARVTETKMELTSFEQAIEQYLSKYSDYPPDFSDWVVVRRHYKKIFPRIATSELALLQRLCDVDPSNDFNPTASPAAHDPTRVDRAEALVWALQGYSDNVQFPFTGKAGPLTIASQTPSQIVYQINSERPNQLFDFKPEGLNYSGFNTNLPVSAMNRYVSRDDDDLFLTYSTSEGASPYVYFDSRTYDYQHTSGAFNGYFDGNGSFGGIRPFLSDLADSTPRSAPYSTPLEALNAWKFVKPDTFQVISAGSDKTFSSLIDGQHPSLFFQYPSGQIIDVTKNATSPGQLKLNTSKGYQETSVDSSRENAMLDNIANFSSGQLVDDAE